MNEYITKKRELFLMEVKIYIHFLTWSTFDLYSLCI